MLDNRVDIELDFLHVFTPSIWVPNVRNHCTRRRDQDESVTFRVKDGCAGLGFVEFLKNMLDINERHDDYILPIM